MRTGRATLANPLILFGFGLVLISMLSFLLGAGPITGGPLDTIIAESAKVCEVKQCETGLDYQRQALKWVPVFTMFLGMIQLIAGAAFEAQGGT